MRRRRQKRAIAAQVSIHASVKDATWFCRWLSMLGRGFNPRICKRCDFSWSTIITIRISFNPRICKRCDFYNAKVTFATSCFNPRICKRCDIRWASSYFWSCCFNPRICKRCDKPIKLNLSVRRSFNPRICKRCDTFTSHLFGWIRVSIHASVKDATGNWIKDRGYFNVSIHASVKDATWMPIHSWTLQVFQSTHL